jgi:hypothetical protein
MGILDDQPNRFEAPGFERIEQVLVAGFRFLIHGLNGQDITGAVHAQTANNKHGHIFYLTVSSVRSCFSAPSFAVISTSMSWSQSHSSMASMGSGAAMNCISSFSKDTVELMGVSVLISFQVCLVFT